MNAFSRYENGKTKPKPKPKPVPVVINLFRLRDKQLELIEEIAG